MRVRRLVRPALLGLLVSAWASWPGRAVAEPAICLTAPVEGQKLRKAEKLLDARDKFLACAQKVCPSEIVDDCARWASEVESVLPSIILAARDATGHDVPEAHASVDGRPFAPLGERPVRLDPGSHVVLVRAGDGKEIRREFTLHEGEKAREIAATFGVPLDATGAPIITESVATPSSRPVPPAVWVAGGVGAATVLSFVVAGTLGLSARASSHCDVACPASAYDDVESKYHVADASLAIGVVAFGVAGVLYFMRPAAPVRTGALELRTLGAGVAALGWRF